MPNNIGNLGVQWQQQQGQTEQVNYDQAPATYGENYGKFNPPPQQEYNTASGYDKLHPVEKWVMEDFLPGFSQSGVGKALEWFGNTGFGKALGVLDFAAEGLERGTGVLAQFLYSTTNGTTAEFWKNIGAAWEAGSLSAEASNVPTFRNGRLEFPTDLPGVAALVDARQKIAAGAKLEDVRAEFLDNQGALALRSQLQDAMFHILGDPLNIVMPLLKPIERLHTLKNTLLITRRLPGAAEDLSLLGKIASQLDDVTNIERIAGDAKELASLGNKVGAPVTAADLRKLTTIIGDPDIAKLGKTGLVEEIARVESHYNSLKELSYAEQKFLQFWGGIPGSASVDELEDALKVARETNKVDEAAFIERQIKVAKALAPRNAFDRGLAGFSKTALGRFFRLTPQARAHEFMNTALENIRNYVVSASNNPEEIARVILRAADGTLGPEFGHMVVSVEGRQVAGAFRLMAAETEDYLEAFQKLSFERTLFTQMGDALGADAAKIVQQLNKGEGAGLFSRFTRKLEELPDLKAQFDNLLAGKQLRPEQFTAEFLSNLAAPLGMKDGKIIPWSVDLFKYGLMDRMIDNAAKVGVLQFGVKQQGFLNTLSDAMKSAENLAFLRLNPSYPIRNGLNNIFTMIARGTFGNVTGGDIERFIQRIGGIKPARFSSGTGAIGDEVQEILGSIAEKSLSEASMEIQSVVRGKGSLQKFSDFMNSIGKKGDNPAKWDMGALSAQIEKWSSERAYATAYMRAMPNAYKPSRLPQSLVDALGDDVAGAYQSAVRGAWTDEEIDALSFADNINLSSGNIRTRANELFGSDIGKAVGEENTLRWSDDLAAAAKKGRSAIDDAVSTIRSEFQAHMEDAHSRSIQNLVDETLARAETEGPGAIPGLWDDIQGDFYATGERHVTDLSAQMERAARIAKPELRNVAYRKLFEDSDAFYGRMWQRQEARFSAIQVAAKKGGVTGVDTTFKTWRSQWQGFFEQRNKLWTEYGEALSAKIKPEFTPKQIQETLDMAYRSAVDSEATAISQIDQKLSRLLPQQQRGQWLAWRERVADLRAADKEQVMQFRQISRNMPQGELQRAWQEHWNSRMELWKQLYEEERAGLAAMQGDPRAALRYQQRAGQIVAEQAQRDAVNALGNANKIPTSTQEGVPTPQLLNTINKYLPEGTEKFSNLADVPADVAEASLRRRAIEKGIDFIAPVAQEAVVNQTQGLADFHKLVPRNMYQNVVADEAMMNRGFDALDNMAQAARDAKKAKPLKFGDIPAEIQVGLRTQIAKWKGELKDARMVASHMAEYGRDTALLNYSRRYGFDTGLATAIPYEFWFTHSAFNWALQSIDRPAMLTTFLRLKKFGDTAFRPEAGLPTRLRGSIRIPMPFLPDWMGDEIFINPMRAFLPLDNWVAPYDQAMQQEQRDVGAAVRRLDEMKQSGEINEFEYNEAVTTKMGDLWERAVSLAQQDDTEGRLNGIDFATMILNPHAPLMWAYQASKGTPEEIGPMLPLSRSIRGVAGLFGIDTNEAPILSIPAKIRQAIGLHPFDQWDDYRINRMLVNMLADKEVNPATGAPLTLQDIRDAWMGREGPLFVEAKRRMLQEFGVSALGSSLGIPVQSYPTGEEKVRKLTTQYEAAWDRYEKTGDYSGTVGTFLDEHPEYEARLALFKSPEEQMNVFLVDMIWDRYNSLPSLNKKEIREGIPEFQRAFLDPDTRNTETLSPELLGTWLKLMGATPPGTLGQDATPLNLAPPELAQVAQFFYDYRTQNFPNYFELQDMYFKLKEGRARTEFRRQNPEYAAYSDWRWDFLKRNPRVAEYLSENPPTYNSPQELQQAYEQPFNLNPGELMTSLGDTSYEIVQDFLATGDPLPYTVRRQLVELADSLGVSYAQLLTMLQQEQLVLQ